MRKKVYNPELTLQRREEASKIGKDYRPFIRIRDFPSLGEAARIMGQTTGRRHELFSRMEQKAFYIFDFNDEILDIREQFPLFELAETLQIADMLGVKHPKDFQRYPIIMTTDFLLTQNSPNGIIETAWAVKTRQDFEKPRTQEKLAIEKEYWQRRNISWKIIIEDSINEVLVENIKQLRILPEPDPDNLADMEYLKEIIVNSPEKRLDDIFNDFESERNFNPGYGFFLYKQLIRNKELHVNLKQKFNLGRSYHASQSDLP